MSASSTRPGPRPHAPRTTGARTPVPAPTAAAPGAPSYHRLSGLTPVLTVRCAPPRRGDGWLPAADLATLPLAVSFAYLLPVDAAPAAMNLSLPVIAAPL
ncbi:hypothetical protein AB0E96_40250, partial [Kitasatospora sp. NPDC036755]